MIANYTTKPLSAEEYLAWESEQESKHEYENGKIIAMTGGTIPHSQVIANLAASFIPLLRQTNCKVVVSDAKVLTPSGRYYYPDLVVTCDDRDRFARDYLQYPTLIVEVLSPSTEARDRGVKQQHYMLIETLQTYVLVTPEYPRVEIYLRSGQNDTWEYTSFKTLEASCRLNVFGAVPLVDIYEKIEFSDSGC